MERIKLAAALILMLAAAKDPAAQTIQRLVADRPAVVRVAKEN